MEKYKIWVNEIHGENMKEVHFCAKDGYHRIIFDNGLTYTDNEYVAEFFRNNTQFCVCDNNS